MTALVVPPVRPPLAETLEVLEDDEALYRVLYTVEPAAVILRAIRHRGVAYRRRRR